MNELFTKNDDNDLFFLLLYCFMSFWYFMYCLRFFSFLFFSFLYINYKEIFLPVFHKQLTAITMKCVETDHIVNVISFVEGKRVKEFHLWIKYYNTSKSFSIITNKRQSINQQLLEQSKTNKKRGKRYLLIFMSTLLVFLTCDR